MYTAERDGQMTDLSVSSFRQKENQEPCPEGTAEQEQLDKFFFLSFQSSGRDSFNIRYCSDGISISARLASKLVFGFVHIYINLFL